MSQSLIVIVVFEVAVIFAGLALLWRFTRSPAARAQLAPTYLSRWELSPVDFVVFLWCVFFGGFAGPFLALQLLRFFPATGSDSRLVVAAAGFQLGMLAGCFVFSRLPAARQGSPALARPRLNPFVGGAAVFLMAMPVVTGIGLIWQTVLEKLKVEAPPQELLDLFANASSPYFFAALIVLAVVVAPITEECLFRGGIFRYARGRVPRVVALVVPACFFSALHQNLATFPQLVALGVLFSLAYERTGDLRVSMIAHGLFNLNSVALLVSGIER